MADLILSSTSLRTLKNALRDRFPFIKSAHLSEAIAAAAGFRTNIAFLTHSSSTSSVPSFELDSTMFIERLHAFGYLKIDPFVFSEVLSSAYEMAGNAQTKTILPTLELIMPKLFFSYCHVDEPLRDRLEVHLAALKNEQLIETWHDRRIVAGSNLSAAIDENLENADVILLLVSADFLASWYCYSVEMKRALERHKDGTARVIPVILEPCDWHTAPFGKLLAVPKDGKPVTTWANQAEALTVTVRQIRKAVEEIARAKSVLEDKPRSPLQTKGAVGPQPIPSSTPMPAFVSGQGQQPGERPRSSNLRLKKEFSDFDRDKFLHDSFDYMGKFFQTSLEEIAERNSGIQVRFQPHGNEAFSAVIYRDGRAVSECSVRVDGLGARSQGLAFSYSANTSAGSFNEMLTVDADSQSMYFKSLGMQSRGSERNAQLSEQGASEHFWEMFIERLQR